MEIIKKVEYPYAAFIAAEWGCGKKAYYALNSLYRLKRDRPWVRVIKLKNLNKHIADGDVAEIKKVKIKGFTALEVNGTDEKGNMYIIYALAVN
jgi:hypothetical protein